MSLTDEERENFRRDVIVMEPQQRRVVWTALVERIAALNVQYVGDSRDMVLNQNIRAARQKLDILAEIDSSLRPTTGKVGDKTQSPPPEWPGNVPPDFNPEYHNKFHALAMGIEARQYTSKRDLEERFKLLHESHQAWLLREENSTRVMFEWISGQIDALGRRLDEVLKHLGEVEPRRRKPTVRPEKE